MADKRTRAGAKGKTGLAADATATATAHRQRRGIVQRWLRRLALAIAVILAMPLLLSLLYIALPPVSTLMVRDLVTLKAYERDWIAIDAAAPVLLHSVIASEDQTFCAHGGVEWPALEAQFARWRAGEDARGASTISMQVARNLFLWQGPSPVRKALEVPLALWLDLVWSKRRMMEVYINIAELGPQVYGFSAAAQRAFGRPATDLTRRQAALLVAALPLPAERDAARPTSRQAGLADLIVGRARQMGAYIGCLTPPER